MIIGILKEDTLKEGLYTRDLLCTMETYVFRKDYTIEVEYKFDPKIDLDYIKQRAIAIINKVYESTLKFEFPEVDKDNFILIHCKEVY